MRDKWYHFDGCKLLWHMDRVHDHYRDGKRIYPLHIDIGATKKCNTKCVYCYGTFQKMTGEVIPPSVLVRLFQDAPTLGIKSLTLTGDGEPTLNPSVYEAVAVGKLGGLDIGFATNGVALDESKIEVLLNSCTWLRFNLSAVSKESYKTIHGVDLWEKVQANIIQTVDLKKKLGATCTVGLQMVLIPQALDEVIHESMFAISHGLDYFVIKQFSDPGCKEMSQFKLDWYETKGTMKTLKLAQSLSNRYTKIVPKWDMIHSKGVRKYDRCVDCPLIFQISGSGKCYPCGYLFGDERYEYGDLHTQTLKEILDSENYWQIIKFMREKFDVHHMCKGCCRHDFTNAFIWNYLHPPEHINFI
jgi:MoaA/NifB/PqqE/SkfB family radical SAM enzyme